MLYKYNVSRNVSTSIFAAAVRDDSHWQSQWYAPSAVLGSSV